jgi:hypothetical protein
MEDYCFVIMPFDTDLDDVYTELLKPAVENLGLRCIRQDEVDKTGSIVRGIVESIAKAKMIIADLTYKNANVFYELGIANSLGNNTIVIAQNIKDVPFDVSSYSVIVYANTIPGGRALTRNLESRIKNFANWGNKPNNPVQDFLPEKLMRLNEYNGLFQENESNKAQLVKMRGEVAEKAKEAEVLRGLLTQLMGESKSAVTSDAEIIDKAKNVVKQIQEEGEVSINVPSEENDGKKKRIKFTKIN